MKFDLDSEGITVKKLFGSTTYSASDIRKIQLGDGYVNLILDDGTETTISGEIPSAFDEYCFEKFATDNRIRFEDLQEEPRLYSEAEVESMVDAFLPELKSRCDAMVKEKRGEEYSFEIEKHFHMHCARLVFYIADANGKAEYAEYTVVDDDTYMGDFALSYLCSYEPGIDERWYGICEELEEENGWWDYMEEEVECFLDDMFSWMG